jgi:dienelactone hydrolase
VTRTARTWLLGPLIGLAATAAQAGVVTLTDTGGSVLTAHWLPVPTGGPPRPAIVALHGCGGLYRRDGVTLAARYTEYAARFAAAGYHVLLPDSFGSRGTGSICAVPRGERSTTLAMRGADALAAVQWLARRADVDRRRIALLGWSHGATTLLDAVRDTPAGTAPVAGAIAFYPDCRRALQQPFQLPVPLLMLLAADDDWTPPAPCEDLVARTIDAQPAASIVLRVYADSHHGFDSPRPVRFRTDVRTEVSPLGVHQGGNPRARAEALLEVDRFLERILR